MSEGIKPLLAAEGWHVIHLFYSIDQTQWSILSRQEQREAKTNLTELVQEIRSYQDTQLLSYSIVTPKADLGFMLMTPDLQDANAFEKRLTLSLGPDILQPVYSYFSQTESQEYQGAETECDSEAKQQNLYPVLPEWPAICFFPMSMHRSDNHYWYALDYETRHKLISEDKSVTENNSDRIIQIITGSTGLDEHEWGVTLLAHDTTDIKSYATSMRFTELSAKYREFGDFYIGLNLPLNDLFKRICI